MSLLLMPDQLIRHQRVEHCSFCGNYLRVIYYNEYLKKHNPKKYQHIRRTQPIGFICLACQRVWLMERDEYTPYTSSGE